MELGSTFSSLDRLGCDEKLEEDEGRPDPITTVPSSFEVYRPGPRDRACEILVSGKTRRKSRRVPIGGEGNKSGMLVTI